MQRTSWPSVPGVMPASWPSKPSPGGPGARASPPRTTWYEPHTDADAIARGIAFALSTAGVHAFCTPGDLGLLPTVLDAAEANEALDEPSREATMAAAMEHEVIFPLGEKARRRDRRRGRADQRSDGAGRGHGRATVSADADRTGRPGGDAKSDQISHLLGSYCHQRTPLR